MEAYDAYPAFRVKPSDKLGHRFVKTVEFAVDFDSYCLKHSFRRVSVFETVCRRNAFFDKSSKLARGAYRFFVAFSDDVFGNSSGELFFSGEEKFSRRIAENIVRERDKKTISTTGELAALIEKSVPAANRFKYGNPSKRVFQAIRIEVNGELNRLDEAVSELIRRLNPKGRICVISFHSLEDRIIKNVYKYFEADCICDKSLPKCVCGKKREIKILTPKPITATKEELEVNSRAECAKLRIAEKL